MGTTPINRYIGKNVKRNLMSRISGGSAIGSETEIGENSQVLKSVIGANC